jgi:hypothetical protein
MRRDFLNYRKAVERERVLKPLRARIQKQLSEEYRGRRILLVCDFYQVPLSYDFTKVLVSAEIERRRNRLEKIDVVLVCHDSDPTPERHPYVNSTNYRHYLHNITLEILRLVDTVGSVFVFDNRGAFQDFLRTAKKTHLIHPKTYDKDAPWLGSAFGQSPLHFFAQYAKEAREDPSLLCLHASKHQVVVVRKWLMANVYPKVPIVITLREWERTPKRNNDFDEWQKLIDHYSDSPFQFIVLRDYYKLYDKPVLHGDNVLHYNEPVIVLSLRAALYQECTLNLCVNNGCMALMRLNSDVRYIVFKNVTNEWGTTADSILEVTGMQYGEDWPGASKYQRTVWESDSIEVLTSHVSEMLGILEADGKLVPSFYDDDLSATDLDPGAGNNYGGPPVATSAVSQTEDLRLYGAALCYFLRRPALVGSYVTVRSRRLFSVCRDQVKLVLRKMYHGLVVCAKACLPKIVYEAIRERHCRGRSSADTGNP